MTSSIRILLVSLSMVAMPQLPVRAEPPLPPEASDPAPADAAGEAARLFSAGRAAYERGDYQEAIARFRRANELSPDPLVLFAIAQAQRLAGDCAALDGYASFLRAAPDTNLRATAEDHMARLATG